MNRRSFLRLLGLAPFAAGAAVVGIGTIEEPAKIVVRACSSGMKNAAAQLRALEQHFIAGVQQMRKLEQVKIARERVQRRLATRFLSIDYGCPCGNSIMQCMWPQCGLGSGLTRQRDRLRAFTCVGSAICKPLSVGMLAVGSMAGVMMYRAPWRGGNDDNYRYTESGWVRLARPPVGSYRAPPRKIAPSRDDAADRDAIRSGVKPQRGGRHSEGEAQMPPHLFPQ